MENDYRHQPLADDREFAQILAQTEGWDGHDEVSPSSPPIPTQSAEQHEQQERVKVQGRLGANPVYKTLRDGGLRVGFSLAEHIASRDTRKPDDTVWHKVYSTRRYAERIQGLDLRRGMLVEI